jgi:hypothetical protein
VKPLLKHSSLYLICLNHSVNEALNLFRHNMANPRATRISCFGLQNQVTASSYFVSTSFPWWGMLSQSVFNNRNQHEAISFPERKVIRTGTNDPTPFKEFCHCLGGVILRGPRSQRRMWWTRALVGLRSFGRMPRRFGEPIEPRLQVWGPPQVLTFSALVTWRGPV